jgi:hypothetical protein
MRGNRNNLLGKEFDHMSQESLNMFVPHDPGISPLGICLKDINKNADEEF